jgi:hypothetical protein
MCPPTKRSTPLFLPVFEIIAAYGALLHRLINGAASTAEII